MGAERKPSSLQQQELRGTSQISEKLFLGLFHSTLLLFDVIKREDYLPNMMQLPMKEAKIIPVFQNLTLNKIMRCDGFETLFSIPVAQNLSFLKSLTLYGCVNLLQVLASGGTSSEPRVQFEKLETLVFKHLPRLNSFCEDDVGFGEFPELRFG